MSQLSDDCSAVLANVTFRDWWFRVVTDDPANAEATTWLCVAFLAKNTLEPDGPLVIVHGRKWRLSAHMTPSELVQTALMAVLAALEHEAREEFTYCGERVFGPHFNVDDLVVLAKTRGQDGARPE